MKITTEQDVQYRNWAGELKTIAAGTPLEADFEDDCFIVYFDSVDIPIEVGEVATVDGRHSFAIHNGKVYKGKSAKAFVEALRVEKGERQHGRLTILPYLVDGRLVPSVIVDSKAAVERVTAIPCKFKTIKEGYRAFPIAASLLATPAMSQTAVAV